MTPFLLIAALSILPHGELPERVDDVEVNHFFDSDGREVFSQVIFSDWNQAKGRHDITTWKLYKSSQQYPVYDFARGEYRCCWVDGGRLRVILARTTRETWNQFDRELIERDTLPVNRRRLK